MEKNLAPRYTTPLIKCLRKIKGFDAVCKSTVNLAFNRLRHKRTKIQNIRQVTENEDKGKEARTRQEKRMLLMINILLYETK